MTDRNIYSK